jgi:CRISPR-associated protein Cas1
MGGWHYGWVGAFPVHNSLLRVAQFKAAADPAASLDLARRFVEGKILNCRTLLRRNGENVAPDTLARLTGSPANRAPMVK